MRNLATVDRRLPRSPNTSLGDRFVKFVAWLARCHARADQRQRLAELDPRLRRDIGVSQADVIMETAKPFWR